MKFTLEIECDNAAFDDDPAPELVRILEWVTNDIRQGMFTTATARVLRDINGNEVGSYRLQDD